MRKRLLLGIILVILVAVLAVLIWFYVTITRGPEGPPAARKPKGITFIKAIYGYGTKKEELLAKPHGIALDKQDNIYVTDSENHRVLVFDKNGKLLKMMGKQGSGRGELQFPLGIAVASNGNIYVMDKAQNKIVIFNSKGEVINEIPEMMPLVATVFKDRLYVATYGHVIIYDLDGKLILRWGRRGRDPGQFDFPGGIAVDSKGTIYVSDSNNMRIQALDKNGKVLWVAGKPPKSMADPERLFGLPVGLAMDKEGRLYVIDAFNGTIHVFTNKGKKIDELGQMGEGNGELYYAAGIAYSKDIFYIADKYNNRIQLVRLTVPEK